MKARGPERFSVLLISLLVLAIVSPLAQELTGIRPAITIWVLAVLPLIASVYAIAERKGTFVLYLVIGTAAMVSRWADSHIGGGWLLLCATGLMAVFFALVAAAILRFVLRSRYVTGGVICAALCVYLLFGYVWALVYAIIHALEPAAFVVKGGDLHDFIYFSFVTLSTVGFGDITPVSPVTRSLAYVEAIVGQFYMAVLISRLVALHVTHASETTTAPATDSTLAGESANGFAVTRESVE